MITEKFVFWDWNGTLLNDTGVCITTMNKMLAKRQMPELDKHKYLRIFGFPVKNYYEKLGFDFHNESFEELSVEFIAQYNNQIASIPLMQEASHLLNYFYNEGRENIIVSAMQQEMLEKTVSQHGLNRYFKAILGIDNIYAQSKTDLALEYVKRVSIDTCDAILIGDTLHDHEVAKEIGCRCILVASGHQSEERLKQTGRQVVRTLSDLLDTIERNN